MCIPSCLRWFTRGKKQRRRHIPQHLRVQIAQRQGYKCPICKKPLSAAWDLDHVVRLADDGSNDADNLQMLCTSCHRTKTSRENAKAGAKAGATALRGQERICVAQVQGYRCALCRKRLPSLWREHDGTIVCAPCKETAQPRYVSLK